MKAVTPREYRIRQIADHEFLAEVRITELRPWWRLPSSWRCLGWSGKVDDYATHRNEQVARDAIQNHKERLCRPDEFPKVIYAEQANGKA